MSSAIPDDAEERDEPEEEATFDRTVEEGCERLDRGFVQLCFTGFLGGFDVAIGVLALLLVQQQTHNALLSAIAFSTGFIALMLAKSELFTENFLVPVAAVVAKKGSPYGLGRLWTTTLICNLAAGWLIMALFMVAFPALRSTANELADAYANLGFTWHAFALAIVGGVLITVMTHLEQATESDGVKLVPAVVVGTLLALGHINHAIVASLICFAALVAGAQFGYAEWGEMAGVAIAGNLVGGLALVTLFRLLQVPHKVEEERDES